MAKRNEKEKVTDLLEGVEIGGGTGVEEMVAGGWKSIRPVQLLYTLLAITLSGYSLYIAVFGMVESWRYRMTHLVLILALIFLSQIAFPKENAKKWLVRLNYVFLLFLAGLAAYSAWDYSAIILRLGQPNQLDRIFGTIMIGLVLIACYKKMGWVITALGGLFAFYALYGNVFPGALYHRGMSYNRFIDFMFNQTVGVLGVPLKVASEYVIMFIIFGAFLTKSGAGEFFIKLAFSLTGRMWGGPAKAAVVASALMATINGSGVGNAVATGSITIPLMKRSGYKPHFAAAVEAAASNGGMIMPPIMASVAFLIAEFTRTPYALVMLYGLIPASLYFLAVMMMVHFEAMKTNLCPMAEEDIPNFIDVMKEGGYFLIPIVALVTLLVQGFSPMRAAVVGIGLMVVLSWVRKATRMFPKDVLAALEEGATNTLVVSAACAVAGIIVGVITGTGLGIKFSSMILAVAGDVLPIALLLTMVSSVIMGMGMTAAAVYVIVSALTVPALINMGIEVMAAHFFVYYYGISSALTPPVALAAYGAAGIAGADQNKTAFTACRLAIVTFVIPFAFVYNPALLAIGSLSEILISVFFAIFGVIAISAGLSNWLLIKTYGLQKWILLAAGFVLLFPVLPLKVAGLAIIVAVFVHQLRYRKKNRSCEPVHITTE